MNPYKEEIRRLADLNGGRISAAEVVEAASDPASPLHGYFDWDDVKAANSFRLDQARELISCCRVEITYSRHVVNSVAYVRDPSLPAPEQGYVSTVRLTSRRDQALLAIAAEVQQVKARIDRLRDIALGLDLADEAEARLRSLL